MAEPISSEARVDAVRLGHIGKALFRLAVCIAAVFAVTVVLDVLPLRDRPYAPAFIFLFVVFLVSAAWGFRYAVFVSFLAAVAFSWLLPPVGRFWPDDSRDLLALAAFLLIEIITSYLSRRVRTDARRSEKELRDAIETIPAMAFSIRPDGSTEFVNQRTLEYTGLSAETISEPGWQSTIHPEDFDKHVNKWRASLASGQPFENEVRHRSAGGEYRWFLVRAVPLRDGRGKVLKWYGILTDIEDRKRAEQSVRRTEKELRDVVNVLPAYVWSTSADGAVDFVNERWLEFTGLPLQGAMGWNWEAAVHPDDLSRHVGTWRTALNNGQAMESEVRVQRADGEYRWWFARNVPLRNETGNIVKWYGTGVDIEDRKRAESLLAGEKRILEMVAKGDSLAEILDALCRLVEEHAGGSLASILLLDGNRLRHGGAPSLPKAYTDVIDGAVIGPCAGSCGTAAYRGEQVIVEDIANDPLWADYRGLALPHSLRACWSTPVFSSQRKVIATFAMYYREPRRPSRHDQEIINQITHLAGVAIERKLIQDALRRSETYLAEAERLSHTGSWAFNSTCAAYSSEENLRIWGFDPQQPPPDREVVLHRIHPEDRDRVLDNAKTAVRERRDYAVDFRIVLPDGTIRHVHGLGHPVFHANGELVEVIGTLMDVTDRRRAEEEREKLRQLETHLAHIHRVSMLGELAASLAHEIKQPITAAATNARTSLRWLQRQPPAIEEARESASRVVNDVNRAAESINRIRSFYSRGRQPRELVDVNDVIEEMVVLLRNEACRYSISIRSNVAKNVPKVLADRVELQQVLMNLMLNGIDSMIEAQGPGELTVNSNTEDGQVLISVIDTGVGILKEQADHIFDAFFSTKPQGTGMGLPISRSIIESHGGRLWATKNSGRGAVFHFTLPVEAAARPSVPPGASKRTEPVTAAEPTHSS
jgi:PAS domain S-box-containing protein